MITTLRAALAPGHPPLVMLHGMLGSPSSFAPVLDTLSYPGAIAAVTLPGHGTPAAKLHGSFSANVHAVAASLPRECYLLGYSLGGRMALGIAALAAHAPLGVIAIGAHPGLAPEEREARRSWEREQSTQLSRGLDGFVRHWEALPLFRTQSPAARDAQRQARLEHEPAALGRAFEELGSGAMPSLVDGLAHFSGPICMMAGALDDAYVAHAKRAARLLPRLSTVLVPAAGHNPIIETPVALARLCDERLRTFTNQREETHELAQL
ncbi:MAG: alpha/beta fold hydrolase [Polyangiaceae bacterium]